MSERPPPAPHGGIFSRWLRLLGRRGCGPRLIRGGRPMKHIILLGDWVFDNAAYVAGGTDVLEQVREQLPVGWRATLRAVDGSVIGSVERQLDQLPPEASHLVISVGGNDALGHAGVLDETTRSMADALERLAGIRTSSLRNSRRCSRACWSGGCPPQSARLRPALSRSAAPKVGRHWAHDLQRLHHPEVLPRPPAHRSAPDLR